MNNRPRAAILVLCALLLTAISPAFAIADSDITTIEIHAYWLDSNQLAETGLAHPTRLNMFSTAREALFIQFDQAVDGNPTNLNLTNLSLGISDNTITHHSNNPNDPRVCSATVPGVLSLVSN